MKGKIKYKLQANTEMNNGPSQSTLADRDPKADDPPREPKLSEREEIVEAPATPIRTPNANDNG